MRGGRLCAALAVALLAAILAGSAGGTAKPALTMMPERGGPAVRPRPGRRRLPSERRPGHPAARPRQRGREDVEQHPPARRHGRARAGIGRERDRRARVEPGRRLRGAELDLPRRRRPERPELPAGLRPREDPGAAGVGRDDRQRRRHGRRRRHRHRDRPPRPVGERRPGLRLRPGRHRPARLQRPRHARRRHDRREGQQRHRRGRRELERPADARPRARRRRQRLELGHHERLPLRLQPRGARRQREPGRRRLLHAHEERDRLAGVREHALRARRRQQRHQQRQLPALPVQLRRGAGQPAERDLRRRQRPDRHAGELLELRRRTASTWPLPASA